MIHYIKGDLIELAQKGEIDVLVHGCNCFCTMGAGIAKQVRETWPEAYQADLATKSGDIKKLGTCSSAVIGLNTLVVVNAYTQFDFGSGTCHVDYKALRRALQWVRGTWYDKHIGLPHIGAGLAGGDWGIIRSIIEEEFRLQTKVTVVEYAPSPRRVAP